LFLQILALPEIVRAVNHQCEVYLDGGVRAGTDVLKALALGATAVFLGRPALWGLAVGVSTAILGILIYMILVLCLRDKFILFYKDKINIQGLFPE